jgi:hypothetical protein
MVLLLLLQGCLHDISHYSLRTVCFLVSYICPVLLLLLLLCRDKFTQNLTIVRHEYRSKT